MLGKDGKPIPGPLQNAVNQTKGGWGETKRRLERRQERRNGSQPRRIRPAGTATLATLSELGHGLSSGWSGAKEMGKGAQDMWSGVKNGASTLGNLPRPSHRTAVISNRLRPVCPVHRQSPGNTIPAFRKSR